MSSHDQDPPAMEQILSLMQAKDEIIEELEKENEGYEEELKVLSTEFRKQLSQMDSLSKELREARESHGGGSLSGGETDAPLVEHMERQRSTLAKQREELETKEKRVLELEDDYQNILIKSNRFEKSLSRCGALNRSFLRQLDAQDGLADPEKDAIHKLLKQEDETQRDHDLSETVPKTLETLFGDQLLILRHYVDEKESLKVEIQNLEKQLDAATTSIETLSESGKLRHGIAEELSRRVRTSENENKRFKEEFERIKRREGGLKKRLAECEKDVVSAQMEAASFRDQLAQSQAKYAEDALNWKREMGENERRRGFLVSDLKTLKEERETFAKRLIEINEEYAAKETECEELRNAVRESERQKTTISADYGTTSDELDYAKKVQTALEKERDEWKSDSEQKEKIVSVLRSENGQLQYAVESMEHDLEEYQSLSKTSKEQIEKFATMIEKFQDQMAAKEERAEKLKHELQKTREEARKQLTGLRKELDDALGMKQKSAEEMRFIVDSQDRLSQGMNEQQQQQPLFP
jgi:chromosome segregation ATPase